jgi:hypothetical protein
MTNQSRLKAVAGEKYIVDGVEYSSDVEKAELFGTRLAETFSETSNSNFDTTFNNSRGWNCFYYFLNTRSKD